MTYDKTKLTNIREINHPVTTGHGHTKYVKMKGDLVSKTVDENGQKVLITLKDVLYVPSITCNLLSVGKLQAVADISLQEDKSTAVFKSSDLKLHFVKVPGKGRLYGLHLKPTNEKGDIMFNIFTKQHELNYVHSLFGHCG